jgi:hypothetical protein
VPKILLDLRPGGVRSIPEGAVKYVIGMFDDYVIYSAIISGGLPVAKAPN